MHLKTKRLLVRRSKTVLQNSIKSSETHLLLLIYNWHTCTLRTALQHPILLYNILPEIPQVAPIRAFLLTAVIRDPSA